MAVVTSEELFVARLKGIRAALDWSAQKLADRLAERDLTAFDRRVISKIECGARRVSLDEAAALCEFFGVSLEKMISPEPFEFEVKATVTL